MVSAVAAAAAATPTPLGLGAVVSAVSAAVAAAAALAIKVVLPATASRAAAATPTPLGLGAVVSAVSAAVAAAAALAIKVVLPATASVAATISAAMREASRRISLTDLVLVASAVSCTVAARTLCLLPSLSVVALARHATWSLWSWRNSLVTAWTTIGEFVFLNVSDGLPPTIRSLSVMTSFDKNSYLESVWGQISRSFGEILFLFFFYSIFDFQPKVFCLLFSQDFQQNHYLLNMLNPSYIEDFD
jgi:hypothetical protein